MEFQVQESRAIVCFCFFVFLVLLFFWLFCFLGVFCSFVFCGSFGFVALNQWKDFARKARQARTPRDIPEQGSHIRLDGNPRYHGIAHLHIRAFHSQDDEKVSGLANMTCSSNSVKAATSSCQYTGVSKALYGHMLVCVYICLCVTFYTDMSCSSNSVNADTSQFLLRVGTKKRKATCIHVNPYKYRYLYIYTRMCY